MVSRLAKAMLLACVLSGFCLPAQANTTGARAWTDGLPLLAQTDLAIPPVVGPIVDQPMVRVALLLPTHSDSLRTAAEVVHAGFQAGFEREPDGVEVQLVATGDAPQDVLSGFNAASIEHDIIAGPLTRSGTAEVVLGGMPAKPTIALAAPDTSDAFGEIALVVPAKMLVAGLSVEDEARQVAKWAAEEHPRSKALVVFTEVAWQRRAARAFEQQWQQLGRESESVPLMAADGFVNGRALLQMKKELPPDTPLMIFAALDARQARQVRALMGHELPLYGTSQLNPFPRSVNAATDTMPDMDGVRLVEMPWQLQPEHPAVMAYPPLRLPEGMLPNADLERLYALGIDAYRIAHEIAMQRREFELDGVTGRLSVRMQDAEAVFVRTMQQAVYRNGSVVPYMKNR